MFAIKMVGFRAFWWYYFAHFYTWGPITKGKWLVGLGVKFFFIPKGVDIHPCRPSPYATDNLVSLDNIDADLEVLDASVREFLLR